MHLLTVTIGLVATLLSIGCNKIETTEGVEETPINNSRELPDNYTHLDQPTWVPTFDLPDEWIVSPSYAGSVRSTSTDFRSTFINIELDPEASSPKAARDELYDHEYCSTSEEHSKYNMFSDCKKGFHKSQEKIGGYESQVFRYNGTWRDPQDDVVNIFFQQDDHIVAITVEGDYDMAKPALEHMVSSLRWEWKIREILPDTETRGGL